jgi:hypothetical protein
VSKRLFIPASLLDFQVQASIFWRASRVLRRRVLSDILVPMSHYRIATRLERRCRTSRSDHDMSHHLSDAGAISSYHRGHDVGNGTTQFSSAQTLVASLSACACLQTHLGTVYVPVRVIISRLVSQYCRVSVSRLGHDVACLLSFIKSLQH